jgi:hypothetical protein
LGGKLLVVATRLLGCVRALIVVRFVGGRLRHDGTNLLQTTPLATTLELPVTLPE